MSVELELGLAGQDYEDIRPLNSKAGMSDLFCAHKKGMNIDVVIKRVQRSVQSNIDEKNESEILKKLKHQYLPQIYDIIPGEDGYLYTVMDLIRGVNLQDYVKENGPITQKQAHLWGCQLCEAVQYLQEEKDQKPVIIHCDIKPRNVMVTENGDICLIDFGTSLISKENTQASSFLTPGYAAPEQHYLVTHRKKDESASQFDSSGLTYAEHTENFTSEETLLAGVEGTVLAPDLEEVTVFAPLDSKIERIPQKTEKKIQKIAGLTNEKEYKLSKATDIYAIGATLYYAVSGKRPEAATQEVCPLGKLKPAISDSMITIINRAMSKEPEKRFRDATAMLEALNNVDQLDQSYRQYVVQKRVMTVLLSMAFIISMSSTGIGFYQMRSERENTYLNIISQAEEAKEKGYYEDGRALLETAIQQQPSRADAYISLGVLLYQQGEYQAALDGLENAFRSGNLKQENIDKSIQGELYYVQGSCLYELKQYNEAIEAFQRAIEVSETVTAYYRSLAIALANNNQIQKAQSVLEELARRGATSSDCNIVSAEIAAMQGENKVALELYEKVFNEADDQQLLSHAYLAAAQLRKDEGDLKAAAVILEKSQKRLDSNHNILQQVMLADLYSQMALQYPADEEEYYKKAESVLLNLINSGRGTFATRLNIANVEQALGNYEDAEQYLLELQQLYPQDYRAEMQLAYLYIDWQGTLNIEQRDYDKAISCYDSAKEKYQQAIANGQEDQNMVILTNLIDQLQSAGWL